MPRETVELNIEGDEAYFAATRYLAVLIYPENFNRRTRFINACRATLIKNITQGKLHRHIVTKVEILAFNESRVVDRQFSKAADILNKRIKLAKDIFFISAMSKLDKGQFGFSIERFLRAQFRPSDDSTGSDSAFKNAYRDLWMPSKNILHLLEGFRSAIERTDLRSIDDFIFDPSWLKPAVLNAEFLRTNINLFKVAGLKEEDTIRIMMINPIDIT